MLEHHKNTTWMDDMKSTTNLPSSYVEVVSSPKMSVDYDSAKRVSCYDKNKNTCHVSLNARELDTWTQLHKDRDKEPRTDVWCKHRCSASWRGQGECGQKTAVTLLALAVPACGRQRSTRTRASSPSASWNSLSLSLSRNVLIHFMDMKQRKLVVISSNCLAIFFKNTTANLYLPRAAYSPAIQ